MRREEIQADIAAAEEKHGRAARFLKQLGIPVSELMGQVMTIDLYEILTDEQKLKVLLCKLRNKALW